MSRSEHATRRDPRDVGDLRRKRTIKHLVDQERSRVRDIAPIDPAGIPLAIRDRGYHAASLDDVRAILERVPPHALEGLGRIDLVIDPDADYECLPGVHSGDFLGMYYFGDRSDIHLYGYVTASPVEPVAACYLRLRTLATLVHELGHHVEHRDLVARGRWRADANEEVYAEAIEYAWTRDYVIPYLEEAHAAEVAALDAWLVEHGGIALPLETLIGDPRSTVGQSGERKFFSARSAFCYLMRDVVANKPDTRVEFARSLHYGAYYDEALAILDRAPSATLRADIYVHQGRIDEAAALIAVCPDDEDARQVAHDIARARGQWDRVFELGDDFERLRAAIELERWDYVDEHLAIERDAATTQFAKQKVARLEAIAHSHRGRHPEALAALTDYPRVFRFAELVAVLFEAGAVDADTMRELLPDLRAAGCLAWADRLAEKLE